MSGGQIPAAQIVPAEADDYALMTVGGKSLWVPAADVITSAAGSGTDGQVLTTQADGTLAWETPSGGGGGGGSAGLQTLKRTSGDIAISGSTVWKDIVASGGLDLTLTGVAAGDSVAFSPSLLVNNNSAVALTFDVATIVSGAAVNYFGGTGGAAENGVVGWYTPATAAFFSVSGAAFYTLQAGDISSGSVTLRLRVRASATTSRSILSTATNPLMVAAYKVV